MVMVTALQLAGGSAEHKRCILTPTGACTSLCTCVFAACPIESMLAKDASSETGCDGLPSLPALGVDYDSDPSGATLAAPAS